MGLFGHGVKTDQGGCAQYATAPINAVYKLKYANFTFETRFNSNITTKYNMIHLLIEYQDRFAISFGMFVGAVRCVSQCMRGYQAGRQ